MYQALYRKYRPKNFDEVVGQEVVVQTLRNSVIHNKINHAYLFAGPRGTGKTSLAKIFAKLVNCENPSDYNPCDSCVCCTQTNGQNMDIIEMDAASNNGIDEIREIKNKVNLVPSVGKYKIYIIDEVHMLTIGAFNALLKTLEEPPAHVIFILATTDPHKVPITILSRCQRFDLKKISNEQIYLRLKYICDCEDIKITDEALNEIARLGDGCLRDAISILDQVISYTDEIIDLTDVHEVNGTVSQGDISKLMSSVIKKDLTCVIEKVNEYCDRGKSIIKMTEEIILFLRNCILSKIDNNFFGNTSEYSNITNNLSIDELLVFINIMNESLLEMKKFANVKMILELSFIKMINAIDKNIKLANPEDSKNLEKEIVKVDLVNSQKSEEQINEHIDNIKKKDEKIEENISPEIKFTAKPSVDNTQILSELKEFIKIRINNTLSKFSKVATMELKKSLNQINDYVMDDNYGLLATIILDGELKAVGENSLIFVYKTSNLAYNFNENIIKIQHFLKEALKNEYKVVAVCEQEWEIIKEKFNLKKEQFKYEEEYIKIEDILNKLENKEEDGIQSLFGELVEYN